MNGDEYDDIASSVLTPAPSIRRVVRGGDKLKGVQPDLLNHWNSLDKEFQSAGITPEIKSGFRTAEQQNALFRNPATRARTKGNDGYNQISPHQQGRALDLSFSASQRSKGRQIIADYAKRNGLTIPSDEPWHLQLPKSDPYDEIATQAVGAKPPQASPQGDEYDDIAQSALSQQPLKTPKVTSDVQPAEFQGETPQAPITDLQAQPKTPIQFESDTSEPTTFAARAAQRATGAVKQGKPLPPTHPDLTAKKVVATFDKMPESNEAIDALMAQIGSDALTANQKYRAETGHNLALSSQDISSLTSQNPQGKYEVSAAPTQRLIRIVNAYNRGGITEAQAESKKMDDEVHADLQERVKVAGDKAISSLKEGYAAGATGDAQFLYNISMLSRALYTSGRYGTNSPEYKALEKEDKENQAVLNEATKTVGSPKTTTGEIVAAALELPQITAAGGNLPVSQYVRHLNEGQVEAGTKAMLAIPMQAVFHGIGGATRNLPWWQQEATARAATAGVGAALAPQGQRIRGATVGALLPVPMSHGAITGEEGAPLDIASRESQMLGIDRAQAIPDIDRVLAKREAQEVTESADQAGVPANKLRVTDEQGSNHVIIKPSIARNQRAIPILAEQPAERPNSPLIEPAVNPAQQPSVNLQSQGAQPAQAETTPSVPELSVGDLKNLPRSDQESWLKQKFADVSDARDLYTMRKDASLSGDTETQDKINAELARRHQEEAVPIAVKEAQQNPLNEATPKSPRPALEKSWDVLTLDRNAAAMLEPAFKEKGWWFGGNLSDPDGDVMAGKGSRIEKEPFTQGRAGEAAKRLYERLGLAEAESVKELEKFGGQNIESAAKAGKFYVRRLPNGSIDFSKSGRLFAGAKGSGLYYVGGDTGITATHTLPRGIKIEAATEREFDAAKSAQESRAEAASEATGNQRGQLLAAEREPLTETAQAQTPSEANAPQEPEFVRRARERTQQRAAEKQQGIEYRHAGTDPYELIDSLIVRGWELYDQKVKPTFEEWSQKLREEFGREADPHLRAVWRNLNGPQEETSTAANKAKIDEERASRGAEELPWSPTTKPDEELLASAKQANELKPNEAQQLTQEVLKKPRALSDRETVQIDLHKQDLVNDHNRLLREITGTTNPEDLASKSARLDAIEQEWDDTDRAWRLSGTEKGRSLRSQQITINQNYELLPMKARMKAATGEAKLSPEVEAKIEAQQKRIAELEDRWNKRVAAKEQNARTESLNKLIIEKKIEIRRAGRRRAHNELVKERADIKQQVAQAWAKMKPKTTTLSMSGLGDLDPDGELTRALGDLARNYIEDGVVKAADLVDTIHEQIKDVADLTKRQVSDLLSGYGKIKESVADPVEKKFNEVKSILASTSGTADVLEKGTRPLRRGQQREKPTEDQRRALRELEDAMREKGLQLAQRPYDVKTEQATPLDKAKTTARNRQEQLRKWVADGKREVQGRHQIIPDAELKNLKTENAALEKVVALLNDPAADRKAIERRVSELQSLISKQRANIQSGNAPKIREGAKSTWSPEIGVLERERYALSRVANDMKADVARKAKEAEAAKPIGVYGVEGGWADFEARAKKALAARKRFEKQIADMQQRRKTGDFEKKPKPEPLVHDPDTERLRLEMNREKRKFDADVFNAKIKKEWSERPLWSKGMAYGAGFVRAGVLSGIKILGKIGSALAQRTAQQYGEEGAARIAKPFVRGTAEKATRYGGHMNVESETAFARGFGAGVKEIPHIIRTGESELSQRFKDHYPGIPTKLGRALEVPGRFHFSEKNPLMRGEFERYKELALQEAERKSPGARTNPAVIDAIEERAYKSAKEVILMGDNPFSRMITDAQRRLSSEQKDLVRTIVPVHRVAGNYLNQAINEYGLGIFRGAIRAIHERNPDALSKLTPEEADKTMRLIQRGTLGVIYMALAGTGIGGAAGIRFGGFYKRGRKDEVQPQDIKIGKVTIPHWALHSPPDELAQLIASMKQEWDEGKQREETRGQRFASGVARSTKGVLSQTPFVNELTQITNSLDNGDSFAGWAGRFVASRVEPQVVQEIAKTTDKYQGQDVKRRPRGFTDALKMGLPVARQTVSISPVFGSTPSRASNEVQRLEMSIQGVQKQPDESQKEFEDKQSRVNPYIRKTLEAVVSSPDYDKESDENKIEWLKQAAASGRQEGEDAEPEKPEKPEKREFPIPLVPRGLKYQPTPRPRW